MEPSCNQTMASTSKPKATSFFSLQKLKGSQPTTTFSIWLAHLEEESTNKGECIDSEDWEGIEGITKEFIVCLARAVKGHSNRRSGCNYCSSLDHFICNCLLVAAARTDSHLNQKEGMAPKKGAWAPQIKVTLPKVPQDGTPQGIKHSNTDSLLESQPL